MVDRRVSESPAQPESQKPTGYKVIAGLGGIEADWTWAECKAYIGSFLEMTVPGSFYDS